jgi:flavodoxin
VIARGEDEMKDEFRMRRNLLKSGGLMLAVAAGAGVAAPEAPAQTLAGSSKTLVAYFSRSGNTRLVARQIRQARNGILFEIEPAVPYPEDYETTVRQAEAETKRGFQPPLKVAVSDIGSFETIFLGFPTWGMTPPPVIRSFLSTHELHGKTLVPFITHGGYGRGNAMGVLKKHAPGAKIVEGFVMEGEQEKRVLARVTGWLGKVGSLPNP